MTPAQKDQVLQALRHGLGAGYVQGQAEAQTPKERDENRQFWERAARLFVNALEQEKGD